MHAEVRFGCLHKGQIMCVYVYCSHHEGCRRVAGLGFSRESIPKRTDTNKVRVMKERTRWRSRPKEPRQVTEEQD